MMITAQDAYRIFSAESDGLTVIAGYEYDSYFIFNAVPDRYVDKKDRVELLDTAYAVDKQSGKVGRFYPLSMTVDEYRRGKRIVIFDR